MMVPGIDGDDDYIAHLYSASRLLLTSSKYFRLPKRGALGNGLARQSLGRVMTVKFVAVRLHQWGRRFADPHGPVNRGISSYSHGGLRRPGTRIEIELGKPLEFEAADLRWEKLPSPPLELQKRKYCGKTSPHWYDPDSFHELLMSIKSNETTVREFIAEFDGCSAKASEIADETAGRAANGLYRAGGRRAACESEVLRPNSRTRAPRRIGQDRVLRRIREIGRFHPHAEVRKRNLG